MMKTQSSRDMEVVIQANDRGNKWQISITSLDKKEVTPQDVLDGIADYFMMMGYFYHTNLPEGEQNH